MVNILRLENHLKIIWDGIFFGSFSQTPHLSADWCNDEWRGWIFFSITKRRGEFESEWDDHPTESVWFTFLVHLDSFSFSLKLAFFAPGNGWFGRRDFPLKGALNGLFSGASSLAVSFRECITSKSQMVVYIYIYIFFLKKKKKSSRSLGIWLVVSNIFYFHPYLGKIPNLTSQHIFSKGLVVTTNQYRLGTTSFTHFFHFGKKIIIHNGVSSFFNGGNDFQGL